jgi:hypothetical protein
VTSYETKDSGEREEYDSGMKRDTQDGKPRFDLIIPESVPYADQLLTRIAGLYSRGAEKYEDRNWEQGSGKAELARARSSAFRHFMQWFTGETDEDHAAAVFFNIQAAEYFQRRLDQDEAAYDAYTRDEDLDLPEERRQDEKRLGWIQEIAAEQDKRENLVAEFRASDKSFVQLFQPPAEIEWRDPSPKSKAETAKALSQIARATGQPLMLVDLDSWRDDGPLSFRGEANRDSSGPADETEVGCDRPEEEEIRLTGKGEIRPVMADDLKPYLDAIDQDVKRIAGLAEPAEGYARRWVKDYDAVPLPGPVRIKPVSYGGFRVTRAEIEGSEPVISDEMLRAAVQRSLDRD